ncbi:MAG: QacE family quaternary ammonium compound efflux SMR transporter [Helicobacter sp.]|nr:QacE family quaternary ammonium compound efflux SMR transporter [Helicobacter sp.]
MCRFFIVNYLQEDNKAFVLSILFISIAIAYYCMSLSLKKISVGIAYAIWEIIGLSLITIIAVFVFGVELKMQEYAGLTLAIFGIVLVNLGDKSSDV